MSNVEKLTNGTTGGPVFVYVQDGKIIRITPMEFDDDDAPSWVINAAEYRFFPTSEDDHLPLFACLAFDDLFAKTIAISSQTGRF